MKTTKSDDKENSFSDYLPEAAGILAALGTYGALRKFRPSTSARLRKVQEAAQDGVSVASPRPSWKTKFEWGADDVSEHGRGPIVLSENIGSGSSGSKMTINSDDVHMKVADKGRFGALMNEVAPDAIPKTQYLDETLDKPAIRKIFKDKKTYVKSRFDSRAADQASEGVFPSLEEAKAMELDRPRDFIVQEKLPVSDEFRVHYIAGEPFGIYKRWLPDAVANPIRKLYSAMGKDFAGGGFWPVAKQERQAIEKFMRESLDPLSAKFKEGDELFAGFDVIKTPQGYKIVDQNTSPATIGNPLVSRKLQRLLTGRWGKDVSLAGGIGAGGLAAGGAHLGVQYADE
jgi:hypothetical protein